MKTITLLVKDFQDKFSMKKYHLLLGELKNIKINYNSSEKLNTIEAKEKIIRYVNQWYYNQIDKIPKENLYSKFRKNLENAEIEFI